MIYYLKGTLKHKSPTFIIVEVGGVGYKVNLPLSSYEILPPEGKEITIHTYLYLREDKLELYGFLKEEERDFFLLLISIPQVGPKSALQILSRISPPEFEEAIRKGDLTTLTHVPGIGRKTAQRLILELRERIKVEPKIPGEKEEMAKDVLSALLSLGYTRREARQAIGEVLRSSKERDLAGLIKEALRHI